jgi:proteasome accessory factor B
MAGDISRQERLADVVAFLLEQGGRPVTLDRIVRDVPGYPGTETQAARVMFERDKATLRDEGIPIQTRDDSTYVLLEADYFLPELDLTPEESVALNMAVATVRLEDDPSGAEALWKLGGVEATGPSLVELPAPAHLAVLSEAAVARAPATFGYGGSTRTVHPYGLLTREAFWYLAAPEQGQELVKNFRVDRIEGAVSIGQPRSYAVPDGFDLRAALPIEPWQLGREPAIQARVWVSPMRANRAVVEAGPRTEVEWQDDGAAVLTFDVTSRDGLRSWLIGKLEHARVLEPPELVDETVAWLRAIAGAPQ